MSIPMLRSSSSSSVPSLPPPSPKSPPEYPDLYGKRREMAKVQMLEREISFLEEELKSVEGLQPASKCCKELADYVVANSDPLLPSNKKNRRSCRFWKWLWSDHHTMIDKLVKFHLLKQQHIYITMTVNHAAAAVVAVAATVFHHSVVVAPYLSGAVAVVSLVPNHPIAVNIAVVREIVVLFQVVAILGVHHALLYAVANAPALVLAQLVQR
ncbi:guanine nucleotide-binding protein subunit gamma 3-like [Trifolium pratense]|uniref:Guanine nucleotide-binding protein subunit gamma 3-like n=1 Tax=Trifolium pratense TaxID=57577 RepID=A0A2K3PMZ6_TRIPR|nr:guanine nucleotide-binding protein subunit gamma 3-like [Trifolium pratense]